MRRSRIMDWTIAATNSMGELALIYCCLLMIASGVFVVAEDMKFDDALWLSVITSTSTGYGDIYPKTGLGRFFASAIVIATQFLLLPLMAARFTLRLVVDNDAFTHDEQVEILRLLREIREEQKNGTNS